MPDFDWRQLAFAVAICLFVPFAGSLPIFALRVRQRPDVRSEMATLMTSMNTRVIEHYQEAVQGFVRLARSGHEGEIRRYFSSLLNREDAGGHAEMHIPYILAAINSRDTRSDLLALARPSSDLRALRRGEDSFIVGPARAALAYLAADRKANIPQSERQEFVNLLHGVLSSPLLSRDPAAQLARGGDTSALVPRIEGHSAGIREHSRSFIPAARQLGEIAASGYLSLRDCRRALREVQTLQRQLRTYAQDFYDNDVGRAIGILEREIARQTRSSVPRKLR